MKTQMRTNKTHLWAGKGPVMSPDPPGKPEQKEAGSDGGAPRVACMGPWSLQASRAVPSPETQDSMWRNTEVLS